MTRLLLAVLGLLFAMQASSAVAKLGADDRLLPESGLSTAQQERASALQEVVAAELDAGLAKQAIALIEQERDVLIGHWVSHQLLRERSDREQRDRDQPFLDWAREQPVRVWQRHPETAADWFLPVFDLAADVADLERGWSEIDERERWASQWKTAPQPAMKRLIGTSPAGRRRAAEALAGLDPETYSQWRAEAAGFDPADIPIELWRVAARRAADPTAVEAVLKNGDAEARLEAVGLAAALPANQALRLLVPQEQDPILGSAATLRVVPLLLALEPGSAEVLRRLATPGTRDSAAAALLRMPEAVRLRHYSALWKASQHADQQKGVHWAVELDGSPVAQLLQRQWRLETRNAE